MSETLEVKKTAHGWSVLEGHTILADFYGKGQSAHKNAVLFNTAPQLLAALRGAADALREAGRSFIIHNPLAARPNLFELHEAAAREAIAKAEGR